MFTQYPSPSREYAGVISIDRQPLVREVECATYKLAKSTVQDDAARDSLQADTEDPLDSTLIEMSMKTRLAEVVEMLTVFLDEDYEQPSSPDGTAWEFRLRLSSKPKAATLTAAKQYIHDYVMYGTVLDWHRVNGSQYSMATAQDMVVLKSKIVNLFRGGFVRHGYVPDMHNPK